MNSNKGLGHNKPFWPIRMKRSKPFCRQLTHYAETLLNELLSNISRNNCPTPIISTKVSPLTSCVISLAQYIFYGDQIMSGLKFAHGLIEKSEIGSLSLSLYMYIL